MLSAKEHSPNLIPVLLYGGSSGEPSAAAHKNILWYREQGGIVYHHNLTFMSELQVSKFTIYLWLAYASIAQNLQCSKPLHDFCILSFDLVRQY